MFQSTLPRGERHLHNYSQRCQGWFQSTLPRGERPKRMKCCMAYLSFNPRSRVGSDFGFFGGENTPIVSIHAPAWGATQK